MSTSLPRLFILAAWENLRWSACFVSSVLIAVSPVALFVGAKTFSVMELFYLGLVTCVFSAAGTVVMLAVEFSAERTVSGKHMYLLYHVRAIRAELPKVSPLGIATSLLKTIGIKFSSRANMMLT